ncbi:winged helix-turn-helix transcriptional regulator [Natronoglycomyces albus]|uniref:Response regulator transcription factor n=1 Tax=Natronoglycomyces albus TaxID=2811108 RepID=A0A895XN75_9ACTN|nr:response regulator transcription factor [Natronoglycomyces albus]
MAALELLGHRLRYAEPDVNTLLGGPAPDLILVDARTELADARSTCRLLQAAGGSTPVIAVVTEAGLVTLQGDWGIDDFVLDTAGPAEVEARLRLASGTHDTQGTAEAALIRVGALTVDPETYAAKLKGQPLDLTYKEFELLRFLAQHPGRVFTREQLLREVWGYDFFGGTRTVDVHVRRLRAKLGSEHEALIGTVRQVGYKFVAPPVDSDEVVAQANS